MAQIKSWSTAAASNNAVSPDGFPENMSASGVNNSSREVMAAVRTWYDDYEWRDWGHTVTRTGNTTFTVPTDVTAIYTANRPIRCTDSSTLYGIVASSSYSNPTTTVTVALDSGNLSASLTAVAVGFKETGDPIHVNSLRGVLPIANGGTGQSTGWATFTPTVTLVGGAGNTVPVYTTNSGRSTRIGNTIHAKVLLSGDGGAEGAGTGVLHVLLPVAVGASAVSVRYVIGRIINNASIYVLTGAISAGETTIALGYFPTATTHADVTGAEQNNATRSIEIDCFYEVD